MEILNHVEVEKFKGEGSAIEQQAMALQVKDETTRAEAADIREQARQFKKNVEEKFSGAKEAAHKAHAEICALISEITSPADRIMKSLNNKMSDYQLAEDRKRAEAQAKIDAEARAKEQAEKDRLMKLAEKQMDKGNLEKANETLSRVDEVFIPAPVLPSLDKSVKTESGGTSSSKDFEVIVTDPMAVIKAIAVGQLPIGAVEIKTGALKTFAKMHTVGDKLPELPGCRITAKYIFSGRAANYRQN